MTKTVIYLISGLGANHSIFENLEFPDGLEIKHINWIKPAKKEAFSSYCKRLAEQINFKNNYFIVGVSFGGVVAQEMRKFSAPKKVIIISSLKSTKYLPIYYKVVKILKLYNLFPFQIMKKLSLITNWFFSVKNQKEREMLKEFINTTETSFIRWAITSILNWENSHLENNNLVQIHGSKDRLIPLGKSHPEYVIEGGGHFMVHNKPTEISKILREVIC